MANVYIGRQAVKDAAGYKGDSRNMEVDRVIEGVSRDFDRATRRFYIPKTETRLYRWPPHQMGSGWKLYLDQDLLAVTTLQAKAQDGTPTTIASTDYFLEPNNVPPYQAIEIDLSSSAAFESGDTPQRSISVAGRWGYSEDTKSAGTVDGSGLASGTTATEFAVSNGSLVDAGLTLLIESEQLYISDVQPAALGAIQTNDGSFTADDSDVTLTLDSSHGVLVGERIRLESEELFVRAVSTNDLTVDRAVNGTVLAAHSTNTPVHVFRTVTVERGANGTTAATHADAVAMSVYEPPFDVVQLMLAEAIAQLTQQGAGWGRQVGQGDGAREFSGRDLATLRERVTAFYLRARSAAV
jgi:hypothetical protein